jgi:hypothetical protein
MYWCSQEQNIIEDVQTALQCAHFDFRADPTSQPAFDHFVATLRELQQQGMKLVLRHRPRRFNMGANQLTRKAHIEHEGYFEHDLLSNLCGGRDAAIRVEVPDTSSPDATVEISAAALHNNFG